jgi:phospholipase C
MVSVLLLAACSGNPPAGSPQASTAQAPAGTVPNCGAATPTAATYDHVIWIWFENRDYSHIIGDRNNAPYFNKVADACGLATDYHGITHPSLPNYLSAAAGGRQGNTYDCVPANCPQTGPSLFTVIDDARQTWKSYLQGMPGNCWRTDHGNYAPRHNPAVYFDDLKAACARADVPMGSTTHGPLVDDLKKNALPNFAFIAPDLCDDTHNCGVPSGDSWLATWLPIITSSPAYLDGKTAIFLTFDEGEGKTFGENCVHSTDPSCHLATIVVSPFVPRGRRSGAPYTAYSLLRTTEEMLGVTPLLGNAAQALSMRTGLGL